MCVWPSHWSGVNPSDSQKDTLAGAALTVTSWPGGCAHQQHRCQMPADTAAAEGGPDIEAAHAQGTRYDRLDCQTADPGERAVNAGGEQSLAFAIKASRARFPIGREPLYLPQSLGTRFCLQDTEACG